MTPPTMDAHVQEALLESLHTLSQPLTALSFALTLMSYKLDLAERSELLRSAQAECERAMLHVTQIRAFVDEVGEPGCAPVALDSFRSTVYRPNARIEVA